MHGVVDFELLIRRIFDKDADLLYALRELRDNRARRFHIDSPWAFLIEHEPKRIGTGIDRQLRIFEIRNSADLDPSHTQLSALSYQLSAFPAFAVAALSTNSLKAFPGEGALIRDSPIRKAS